MNRPRPEPMPVVKYRRDAALLRLTSRVPYIAHLGISFQRHGDELTSVLHYGDHHIGNPVLPALHGGAIAGFLETTALIELAWRELWEELESGVISVEQLEKGTLPPMPKTIDFTLDYLRSGLPRDAYARARVNRSGRRYASVHVEAWQDNRTRLFAQATGHFLMPQVNDS